MNYIILNNKEFFKDKINIGKLKEVDLNGEERVDAIFGEKPKHFLDKFVIFVV